MTAAFGSAGTAARAVGGTGGAPPLNLALTGTDIPAGSAGELWVIPTWWGNSGDLDPSGPGIFTNLGEFEGGAGTWGVDAGKRHITGWSTETDLTGTTQTFQLPTNDVQDLLAGVVTRWTKSLAYWTPVEIAVAADNATGSTMSATFNRDPGFVTGDQVLLMVVANTDSVNPAGITVTIPGTTQGTGTTAVLTSASTAGNDSRYTLRRMSITGTSTGPATIASTTDFAGVVMMFRIRDTATAPVTMNAGPDQISIRPGQPVTLTSATSSGIASGRTWTHVSGPASVSNLSSATATSPTYNAPVTLDGGTDVWRVTDNTSGLYDDVEVTVLPAERKLRTAGGLVPLVRRMV